MVHAFLNTIRSSTAWRHLTLRTPGAQEVGVGGPDVAAVPGHHQLHLVLVHVHHSSGCLLVGGQEENGEGGYFELGADSDEGASHWLDQAIPAELDVQDVVVFVWLERKNHIHDYCSKTFFILAEAIYAIIYTFYVCPKYNSLHPTNCLFRRLNSGKRFRCLR